MWVTLSSAFSKPVSVNYDTSDDSAKAGTNYLPATGVLTFVPGRDVESFQIELLDDLVATSTLSLDLTLSLPQNATLGTQSAATFEIDDVSATPTVAFSRDPVYVVPANSTGLRATLNPPNGAVTFDSADRTVAVVTPGPAGYLRVTGVAVGTTKIMAMLDGTEIGSVTTNVVAGFDAEAAQDLPVDSINIVDSGKGVAVDQKVDLGFALTQEKYQWPFKVTVTRANADAMKKSTIKQELVNLLSVKRDKNGVISYDSIVQEKEKDPFGIKLVAKKDWDKAKKQWDKDGMKDGMTLDVGMGQMDGTPEANLKTWDASALQGKQFLYSDLTDVSLAGLPADAVAVYQYRTFRVTSTLAGGKTITAEFKMSIEVAKVNGNWQKTTANMDPKLPKTWPEQ